jgi:hypothetical protein
LLAAASIAALAFGPVAVAQVPPLPPETQGPLEVVAPIAHPACGNAIIVATILSATAPVQSREALELVTANIFTACGSVPVPATVRTRCADDEAVASVLALVSAPVIGGALPVAPPSAGQVVDAIRILQDRFPVPADDEGLLATLADALECRFAAAPRPSRVYAPPDDGGFVPPPGALLVPGAGLVPVGDLMPGTIEPDGLSTSPDLAEPVLQSAPAPEPMNPVSHPLFLVPLILIAAAVLIGRGLIARPTD